MPFVPIPQEGVRRHARPEDLFAWDPSEGDAPKMRATLLNGIILPLGARPGYARNPLPSRSPFPLYYRANVNPLPSVIVWLEETWYELIKNASSGRRELLEQRHASGLVKISLHLNREPVLDLSKQASFQGLRHPHRFKYRLMSPVREFRPAAEGAEY